MDLKFLKLLLFIFLLMYVGYFKAQIGESCEMSGCCCSNDPTPAGVMISHAHAKKEWMLSYRFMGMGMSGIQKGSQQEDRSDVLHSYTASPETMQMNMHMLMAMYGISDRFTAMLMLNYTSNYMEMSMPVGKNIHTHGMSNSGLADTKLYLLYAPIKKEDRQLLVSAGLNLPTGNINARGEAGSMMFSNLRLPYSMQLGSGTYDILPGITYLGQKNKFTYSAQATAIIRPIYNSLHYKLGNELNFTAWTSWQCLSFLSTSFRLDATTVGKISGQDASLQTYDELSTNPANYGGQRVSAFLGLSFQPKKSFFRKNRLSAEYGIPFYQNLNGTQMTTKHLLYLSWSLLF